MYLDRPIGFDFEDVSGIGKRDREAFVCYEVAIGGRHWGWEGPESGSTRLRGVGLLQRWDYVWW